MLHIFSIDAMINILLTSYRWGVDHENCARLKYMECVSMQHQNFQLMKSGLLIHTSYPHLGASPDGVISCNCCGNGVLEVKCPYNARQLSLEEATDSIDCLEVDDGGALHLMKTHPYYYQVQAQMHISQAVYADFVVWTLKGIHIERIYPSGCFITPIIGKITTFFRLVILPELIGKWFTKSKSITESTNNCTTSSNATEWCYCKVDHEDDLIGCDNVHCPIQWFHLSCLEIEKIPKGKWYCPDCRFQYK